MLFNTPSRAATVRERFSPVGNFRASAQSRNRQRRPPTEPELPQASLRFRPLVFVEWFALRISNQDAFIRDIDSNPPDLERVRAEHCLGFHAAGPIHISAPSQLVVVQGV